MRYFEITLSTNNGTRRFLIQSHSHAVGTTTRQHLQAVGVTDYNLEGVVEL